MTLSLNNAKVYYLEIPNDFSHTDDNVNKWLQLTDNTDSDDSETGMSSKNETDEENWLGTRIQQTKYYDIRINRLVFIIVLSRNNQMIQGVEYLHLWKKTVTTA